VHSGRKHRALARRISRRLADYLTFARNPDVPLTNNGAEQKRPMAKIRQKVSGTMRTLTGAHLRQAPQLHQTTAKHGHPMLNALPAGTPGYPATPDQLRAGVPSDIANATLVWPKTLYALTYE
jgi:transposase